jgi:alpha-L-fucosidase
LDWREPSYREDFSAYLTYLRASVEILCTRYGEIGGLWFDGKWDKPTEDWQEDALYATIRRHQPNAIIINNTGLHERGQLGHIELDSVTFERGRPGPINLVDSPKYIASEMCQTMGDTWGYGADDLNYKSPAELIEDLCVCRRCGANMLLNVGPRGDGTLRPLDVELLRCIGRWTEVYREAAYLPRPTDIIIADKPKDFVLKHEGNYYLFCHGLGMSGDGNAVLSGAHAPGRLAFDMPVRRITWLDNGRELPFEQKEGELTVRVNPFPYGTNLVVRVAKIEI